MSPLIPAALSIAGNLIGDSLNRESVSQRDKESREWQERMFHEQQAYESPSAVVSRLQAAGLNPNLALGNINPATNVPQPAMSSPVSDLSRLGSDAVSAMSSLGLMDAQEELMRSEAYKNYHDAEGLGVQLEQKWKELELKDKELADLLKNNESYRNLTDTQRLQVLDSIDSQRKQRELIDHQITSIDAQSLGYFLQNELTYKDITHYEQKFSEMLKNWAAERNLNYKTANKLDEETQFMIHSHMVRLMQLRADFYKTLKESDKIDADTKLTDSNIKLTNRQVDLVRTELRVMMADLEKKLYEGHLYGFSNREFADSSITGLPFQLLMFTRFLFNGLFLPTFK